MIKKKKLYEIDKILKNIMQIEPTSRISYNTYNDVILTKLNVILISLYCYDFFKGPTVK